MRLLLALCLLMAACKESDDQMGHYTEEERAALSELIEELNK